MLNLKNLFVLFSMFLVFSSTMVIISQNSIISLLFLVSSFIFSAFLLIILECEFLALMFIIIYVGAIAVLFLFAVMMLESKSTNIVKNKIKYLPVSFTFIIALFLPLLRVLNDYFDRDVASNIFYLNKYLNWFDLIDATSDVAIYGQLLYSYFVLQFLIAGLILLLVIVGVVYLTNFHRTQSKQQSTFRQLSRTVKIFRN